MFLRAACSSLPFLHRFQKIPTYCNHLLSVFFIRFEITPEDWFLLKVLRSTWVFCELSRWKSRLIVLMFASWSGFRLKGCQTFSDIQQSIKISKSLPVEIILDTDSSNRLQYDCQHLLPCIHCESTNCSVIVFA